MTDTNSENGRDELYHQLTNDRMKAAVAERTAGDAHKVDDPRTAIRYVGEDRGVDQFQVAFPKTQGFPLGKVSRSIQPENHIRDWLEQNDAEIVDAREEELFEPTASEDSIGVALETDGGEGQTQQQREDEPINLSRGEEKVVTCSAAAEEWPEAGEDVTFKAVSGELDQEVVEVDKSRERPVKLNNGGWYELASLVEYTTEVDWKVVEMPDGTEIYVEELGPTEEVAA